MNSRLADINERARQLDLRDDPRMEPPLHPSERGRFQSGPWSIVRRVPAVLGRVVIAFCVGVTATLVWQSYGNTARRMVASVSPRLAWLAPPLPSTLGTAPGPSAGVPPDQLAAISHSLAAVRQSVDKLAADVAKLQAAKQDAPPVRTSGAPPAAAAAQARKPAPAAPTQAATAR